MQNVTINNVYAATYLDESSERQGICFQFSPAKEKLFPWNRNAKLKEYATAEPAEGGKESPVTTKKTSLCFNGNQVSFEKDWKKRWKDGRL